MNNYHHENYIYNTTDNQEQSFQTQAAIPLPSQPAEQYSMNNQNYNEALTQSNTGFHPPEISSDIYTNPTWYKPEICSNRSIEIKVGNDSHQVFVYEEELAKNNLVAYSLINNCGFKSSFNYMYSTMDNTKLRSKAEVSIYFVLKESGILFSANCSVVSSAIRKEPDFSVIHGGRTYILDVLSNGTHNSEKDAKTARFYQDHGVLTRSYSTEQCERDPHEVVDDFLKWIGYRN